MISPRVAIILPPRERFRARDAGAVALTIYDFYCASRYRNHVVVLGGHAEHFLDANYHWISTPFAWLFGRNRAYASDCVRYLRMHQVSLIEVHNRCILALRLKKALPQCKVTLHCHNDPWSMDGSRSAQDREKLLQTLDAVYCVSQYVAERLLDGVSSQLATKVHVIYNAIEMSDTPVESPRQNWIVYAGRFIPEKGVAELAETLAQLLPKFPTWKAVFLGARGFGHEAGQSAYEQQVYAVLKSVAGQVDFRGHVSHDEVVNVLGLASIAVSPSTGAEAFGRATLEAMAAGCAVVTAANSGLKEIAGDAAITLWPITVMDLTQIIERLIQDELLRLSCGRVCQQRASEMFRLTTQVNELDQVRDQLLGKIE